ncbi:MAG: hypothetical protein WCK48_00185 [bacterium]
MINVAGKQRTKDDFPLKGIEVLCPLAIILWQTTKRILERDCADVFASADFNQDFQKEFHEVIRTALFI